MEFSKKKKKINKYIDCQPTTTKKRTFSYKKLIQYSSELYEKK